MSDHVIVARHRKEGRSSVLPRLPRGGVRRALLAVSVVLGFVVVVMVGGAGTFALWAQSTAAEAGTVTSGATGLTVNGTSAAALSGLDTTALTPGSAIATPVTLKNTGTIPLTLLVSGTTAAGGLASHLTVRLAPVASTGSCSSLVGGGSTGPLSGFSTSTLETLAPGAEKVYCLALTLSATAPSAAQAATSAFTMTFDGRQVAP